MTRLKNTPKHYSLSPSYTSDRRLEVLPVNSLPLQSEAEASNSLGPAPSLTDVITGSISKFETSGGEEEEDALPLGSQHHPRHKPRRRRPGRPGSRPRRLSRPGSPVGSPPRRRPRPPGLPVNQVEVEDFFPGDLGGPRPSRPGRRGPSKDQRPPGFPKRKHRQPPRRKEPSPPGPPRIKRKPVGPPKRLSKPPRSHKKRPSSFRPPRKVYNGFRPSLESSPPYDDSPLYIENPKRKPRRPMTSKRPKRKRRPRPVPVPDLEGFSEEMDMNLKPHSTSPNAQPSTPTDFNPFSHASSQATSRPGPPYNDQHLAPPQRPTRPGRPKRQRVPPVTRPNPETSILDYYNEVEAPKWTPDSVDVTADNSGFFHNVQENFPDIEAFGIGWDAQKIRRKRAAGMVRYTPPSKQRRRTSNRGARGPRGPSRRPVGASRRQGPAGFWDDAEFDAEFFNGGAPPSYSSFESFSQGRFQSQGPPQTTRRPNRRPHIASKKYEAAVSHKPVQAAQPPARYSTSYQDPYAGYQQPGPEDNAILGSGNFDILKGGTFYDKNDYRSSAFSHSSRPQSPSYGNNDIFHNFRDFADIKGEKKRPHRYTNYY